MTMLKTAARETKSVVAVVKSSMTLIMVLMWNFLPDMWGMKEFQQNDIFSFFLLISLSIYWLIKKTIISHKIKRRIFINFQHINVLTALDE